MRTKREEDNVFNFGPGIEQLRASCEEQTRLPAPTPPEWHEHHGCEVAE
ncbi:hypothetical protein [Erythrobacter sp.]|jgi:N-methylhydantoinase B|nr:hypothetical protein [Erythrobacter sp.]